MFFQLGQKVLVQGASVARGNILCDVLRLAHSHDRGADHRIRKDETQCHLWQSHFVRQNLLQFFHVADRLWQILRAEISGPPIAFRKARLQRHLPAQAAFVKGNARDHAHVQFLANGEKFVFRRLIEDVVDDLHCIDKASPQRLDSVFRFPPVDAEAEVLNPLIAFQPFYRRTKFRVVGPCVGPDVKLQQVDRIDAAAACAADRHT